MAMLYVKTGFTSDVKDSIDKAVRKLEDRKKDYEDIRKDVGNVQSNTGNLTTCNTYLNKKISEINDNKIGKLKKFKNAVTTFSKNADDADKRVATYIEDETDTFYKAVGIKTGIRGWISNKYKKVKKFVKKCWEGIKRFYEDHKYIIDFVVDALLLVGAIISLIAAIPTGGASLVATLTFLVAIFGAAKATADWVTSGIALGFHIMGDDEQAGIWAERGLRDGFVLIGQVMDNILGTDFFADIGGFVYDTINVAAAVFGIYKFGSDIIKNLANGNWRKISFKTIKQIIGVDCTPGASKTGYQNLVRVFDDIKNGRQAYNVIRTFTAIKNLKTICKITNKIMDGETSFSEWKMGKDMNDIVKYGQKHHLTKAVVLAPIVALP